MKPECVVEFGRDRGRNPTEDGSESHDVDRPDVFGPGVGVDPQADDADPVVPRYERCRAFSSGVVVRRVPALAVSDGRPFTAADDHPEVLDEMVGVAVR